MKWLKESVYRTRDGRYVYLTAVEEGHPCGILVKDPEAITLGEVQRLCEEYNKTGSHCKKAGLDLVELYESDVRKKYTYANS